MTLRNIQIRSQEFGPGAWLVAKDADGFVHAQIPPKTFQALFPDSELREADFKTFESIAKANRASIERVFVEKYSRGEFVLVRRTNAVRPLVTITAEDLRGLDLSTDDPKRVTRS